MIGIGIGLNLTHTFNNSDLSHELYPGATLDAQFFAKKYFNGGVEVAIDDLFENFTDQLASDGLRSNEDVQFSNYDWRTDLDKGTLIIWAKHDGGLSGGNVDASFGMRGGGRRFYSNANNDLRVYDGANNLNVISGGNNFDDDNGAIYALTFDASNQWLSFEGGSVATGPIQANAFSGVLRIGSRQANSEIWAGPVKRVIWIPETISLNELQQITYANIDQLSKKQYDIILDPEIPLSANPRFKTPTEINAATELTDNAIIGIRYGSDIFADKIDLSKGDTLSGVTLKGVGSGIRPFVTGRKAHNQGTGEWLPVSGQPGVFEKTITAHASWSVEKGNNSLALCMISQIAAVDPAIDDLHTKQFATATELNDYTGGLYACYWDHANNIMRVKPDNGLNPETDTRCLSITTEEEIIRVTPGGAIENIVFDNTGKDNGLIARNAKNVVSQNGYLHNALFPGGTNNCENIVLKNCKRFPGGSDFASGIIYTSEPGPHNITIDGLEITQDTSDDNDEILDNMNGGPVGSHTDGLIEINSISIKNFKANGTGNNITSMADCLSCDIENANWQDCGFGHRIENKLNVSRITGLFAKGTDPNGRGLLRLIWGGQGLEAENSLNNFVSQSTGNSGGARWDNNQVANMTDAFGCFEGSHYGGSGSLLGYRLQNAQSRCDVRYMIFSGITYPFYIDNANSDCVIDYNIYHNCTRLRYNGVFYNPHDPVQFANWKSVTGFDQNSIAINSGSIDWVNDPLSWENLNEVVSNHPDVLSLGAGPQHYGA